ncbi:lipase maturation factor family protein [Nitrospinae bacterium]|nr:lipase maturation factor family protein [Nitrospinota bacterium]
MKINDERPVLVYDGACGFCTFWVRRWQHITEDSVIYKASQEVASEYPQIPAEKFDSSIFLIYPDGTYYFGAKGVFKALANSIHRLPLWAYEKVPGFGKISEWIYSLVANNREFFSLLTRWVWGSDLDLPTWYLARRLFIILLGLVYFTAFSSFGSQIEGLIGKEGILPAQSLLQGVEAQLGAERFWKLPTLLWLDGSDGFLKFICLAGAAISLLVIAGFAPAFGLFLLWLFYLSLFNVGQQFLGFQWDTLLLETGLLAIFLAPLKWRPKLAYEPPPSPWVLILLRFLLFRVIFTSGWVKLASGDPTWNDLSALLYHYETQPLPTWIGWYAHQLPQWFQEYSVIAVFITQLVIPFFIFGPGRIRYAAGTVLILFQVLILLTGNYCFFNILTIVLCLLLFDDGVIQKRIPEKWRIIFKETRSRIPEWKKRFFEVMGLGVLVISILLYIIPLFVSPVSYPSAFISTVNTIRPFHIVNRYGLFAVMTTSRPEIFIKGSSDGKEWKTYKFKWKPENLNKAPAFVAPHQPRLDWQMWFAALSNYERNPWLIQFMTRLLQGSTPVIDLLESNPFPQKPPKYIQAVVYDYWFTNSETKEKTGNWWQREFKGAYTPVLQLP